MQIDHCRCIYMYMCINVNLPAAADELELELALALEGDGSFFIRSLYAWTEHGKKVSICWSCSGDKMEEGEEETMSLYLRNTLITPLCVSMKEAGGGFVGVHSI